jgi:hypothetical protein
MSHSQETGTFADYVNADDVVNWMIKRLTTNANKKYRINGTLADVMKNLERKGKLEDIMNIEFQIQNIRQSFGVLPRNEYNAYKQIMRT